MISQEQPGSPLALRVATDLRAVADVTRAEQLARYFQARPGGYGEGDRFLGVTVPDARAVARARERAGAQAPSDQPSGRPSDQPPTDDEVADAVRDLLASPWHEERLTGLLLLVRRYQVASSATTRRREGEAIARERRRAMARLYLEVRDGVDNWDLVDQSAHEVLGAWLHEAGELDGEPAAALRARLAASSRLWDRRIAMISTFGSLKAGDPGPTLEVADLLVGDRHDLIHKAVGWGLREVGNRDRAAEEAFLRVHAATMPRTALRYAIEKFAPEERRAWLRA